MKLPPCSNLVPPNAMLRRGVGEGFSVTSARASAARVASASARAGVGKGGGGGGGGGVGGVGDLGLFLTCLLHVLLHLIFHAHVPLTS